MNKTVHIGCGLVTTATVSMTAGIQFDLFNANIVMPVATVTVALGSLLPDIDLATTTMGRKAPIFSKIFTHRGLTHTLLFPAIIMGMIIMVDAWLTGLKEMYVLRSGVQSLLFGLLVGWVVHIFADLFNSKGCPILWPLSNSKLSFASVKLAHWTETAFMVLYALIHIIFILIYRGWYKQILALLL